MKEKIKTFMDSIEISAAQLADKIGVQRSSFSHILNGRNKPSADFIIKLLNTFPDLDANWLFGNSETMLFSQKTKRQAVLFDSENKPTYSLNEEKSGSGNTQKKNIIASSLPEKSQIKEEMLPKTKKEIEKIVILYSDNSFKEYQPE